MLRCPAGPEHERILPARSARKEKEVAVQQAPLMPKATAVWLVENTSLSFDQIADFCKLHPLEVKGIADGEVAAGIKGFDPVSNGQLTREELEKAQGDPEYRLKLAQSKVKLPEVKPTKKGPRYTPVSRRQDRPNAILWLLRNHPELKDAQIMRLVGTTKSTIQQIRERTHWNSASLSPLDPVTLGLCSQMDLDFEVQRAAKDKPQVQPDGGQTLLPAEVTTAPEPVRETFAPSEPRKPAPAEEEIDVDSVFAKLKQLKRPAQGEDE
ncbi:MAG: hypothetical protein K0S06_3674 [Microvirga sp.]|jgi:hypothetical protein|nr:hypothetical protein [Microvirga sp.]